jgi:hypothetical protein
MISKRQLLAIQTSSGVKPDFASSGALGSMTFSLSPSHRGRDGLGCYSVD